MGELEERVALALAMADEAGTLLRPRFRAPLAVESKADRSPVSEADREVELALRALVESRFPGDGFVGEEFPAARGGSPWQWVVDPIDGTRAFLAGLPTFVTLIALLRAGEPVIGVIDQPLRGERWLGVRGRPTLFQGEVARTRPCARLGDALLATTDPWVFRGSQEAALRRLDGAARTRATGGDGLLYGLLASGQIDVVCECELGLHDFAALVPVVEGAGGRISDWAGRPLDARSDGRVLAVGDPRLHPAALGLLAEGGPWPLG